MNFYEKIIIGGIIAGLVAPSLTGLDGADFSDSQLGAILSVTRTLEAENKPVDAELVYLKILEREDSFYTKRDLDLMATSVKSASVVFEAVEKVKSESLKTLLLNRASILALQDKKSGAELLKDLRQIVTDAEKINRNAADDFIFLRELAPKMEAVYQDLHQGIANSISTGFVKVDAHLIDGFSKSDLHIIAGFTGSGKSSLALNFAANQARNGQCVAIVSREMSDIENIIRLQSSAAQLPRWKVKKDMWDSTYQTLRGTLPDLVNLPIAFNTRTENVEDLRPQVLRMVEEKQLQILYVDYLQLMVSSEKHSTRANEVQKVSRTLKQIATENNIPVVALCQFNRQAGQASVFDLMSFLKESSGIEQDASTILYVQVEKTDTPKDVKDAKLTVLKNRNGATFQPVDLNFHGETFTFTEI